MKKTILLILTLSLSLTLISQELSHETLVINIEVPVRVFRGDKFIDNLTIDDFELFEDGNLQKIEAVYLIKKASVERKEEKKKFAPQISRNFVFLFQITEYLPRVNEALDYFFSNVILPGDNLTVITPMKTYSFKSKALEILSKEEIIKQLKGKLRKDTRLGNTEYINLLRDLEKIGVPNEETIDYYRLLLSRLENLRHIDEKQLLNFAEVLKAKEGQKYVFLFYQKEVLPQIDPSALVQLMSMEQDRQHFLFQLSELYQSYKRDITFNVDRVKQAYADSSISIHFLYITRIPNVSLDGMQSSALKWREQSEDIFSAFREMARATGGLTDSSSDAASAFQRAVDASQNYYLLYYSPSNYKKDGKFRRIKVRVINRNYRISHRAGYFAN